MMVNRGRVPTCWGPSPLTIDGGGGEARIGSSGLRSWPDSRGGVRSAMSPSFTPLKRDCCNNKTKLSQKINNIEVQKVYDWNC